MTFEQITDNEKVINLTSLDLVVHARHQLLSAAKDLIKGPHPGDVEFGLSCSERAEALQIAIDLEQNV
jgi:hypothetical protein